MKKLPNFLLEDFRRLPAARKRVVTGAFAGFVRNAHDGGRAVAPVFDDIAVANAPDGSFVFAGGNGAGSGHPLAGNERLADLASLGGRFFTITRRGERIRFLKLYDADTFLRDRETFRELERRIFHSARRFWRGQSASFGSSDNFKVSRQGRFRIYQRNAAADSVLSHLLPDPLRRLAAASPLPGRGRDSRPYRLSLPGADYLVKHYRPSGFVNSLKDLFRGSRPLRIYKLAWEFLARGVPVPTPVAVIEERRGWGVSNTYLIVEFVAGAQPLWEVWPPADGRRKKALLARAGVLLGRMHACGCLHGDTHWGNILVKGEAGREELVLIDFEGGKVVPSPKFSLAQKDIQHFFRDLFRLREYREEFRDFFSRIWLRWLPGDMRPANLAAEELIAPHYSRRRRKQGGDWVREQMLRHRDMAGSANRAGDIYRCAEMIAIALSKGKKIIIFGDEADARQLAQRLSRSFAEERQVRFLDLACREADNREADPAEGIRVLAQPGDILFAAVISGYAENRFRALRYGRETGCVTMGLLGKDRDKMTSVVDLAIIAPSSPPHAARDAQATLIDILCGSVEKTLLMPSPASVLSPQGKHPQTGAPVSGTGARNI